MFTAPPPAAGWDEAIEACETIADAIEALRRNAPPDAGAGKSEPDDDCCGAVPPCKGCESAALSDHGGADAGVGEEKVDYDTPSGHDYGCEELPPGYAHGCTCKAALSKPAPVDGVDPRWHTELSEIIGHLGSAITQSIASDDQIIMDHVKAAHEIAKVVRRQA